MTDHGSIFVGTITIVAFRRNIIVINNYKINRINVYKKKIINYKTKGYE